MANRAGKREREARRRDKRSWLEGVRKHTSDSGARIVTVIPPLKLGRKKRQAFARSTRWFGPGDGGWTYCGCRRPQEAVAAVPVAEAERRTSLGEGAGSADLGDLRLSQCSDGGWTVTVTEARAIPSTLADEAD